MGRTKDISRLVKFIEDGVLGPAKFDAIVRRHRLLAKWRNFKNKYLPLKP